MSTNVSDYRTARRAHISNFVGFSPDEILRVRDDGINNEIREDLKRMPGVHVSQAEVTDLANKNVEDFAWQLYRKLTQNNADFATLAIDYSQGLTAKSGGMVEPFGLVHNPEPYQTAAYGLKKIGDISEPFSGWDGWRIIRLEKVVDDPLLGRVIPFDDLAQARHPRGGRRASRSCRQRAYD